MKDYPHYARSPRVSVNEDQRLSRRIRLANSDGAVWQAATQRFTHSTMSGSRNRTAPRNLMCGMYPMWTQYRMVDSLTLRNVATSLLFQSVDVIRLCLHQYFPRKNPTASHLKIPRIDVADSEREEGAWSMTQFEKIAPTPEEVLFVASRHRLGPYPPRCVRWSAHLRAYPHCRTLCLPVGPWHVRGRRGGRLFGSVDRMGSSSGRYRGKKFGSFYDEWVSFITSQGFRLIRAFMENT